MNALHGLSVWNRACGLAVQTCAALTECRDRTFRDVLTRACLALPSGIAAGYEQASPEAFAASLARSRAACSELRTQIYIAAELDLIPLAASTELMQETVEIARMLTALAEPDTPRPSARLPRRRKSPESRADL